jgi:uroporphyrin-3 C-methyltransferase
LFAAPAPALVAYRLADEALAQANDAAFASVRQSVAAEIGALNALTTVNPSVLQATLAELRESLSGLPTSQRDENTPDTNQTSRFSRVFGQFIRIRRDDDTGGHFAHNDPLFARTLLDANLRDAQAALLLHDAARWQQALNGAQAQLAHDFDAASPAVAKAQSSLESLAKTAIAPPAPAVLGSALRELRNLRATHSLQAAPPAKPAADAQPEGQP